MYNSLLRLQTFFLGLCLIGFSALSSVAQTLIPANSVVSSTRTSNAMQAVDGSDQTAAVLVAPVLTSAALRVGFPSLIAQDQQVIMLIKGSNGGLLDLSLINNMVVNTYNTANSSSPAQTIVVGANTVNLALLPGSTDITQLTFKAMQAFNHVELQVTSGLSLATTVSLYAVYATVAPLPVSLTAFTGKATATGVVLNWETASEQHNDHFVVERAQGTPESFQALGSVAGGGSSTQQHHYQFVDAQASGLSYYRLRQVDTDGSAHFSPVIAVQAELPGRSNLFAYPTLATETITIVGASGPQVGIFNQLGQQVRSVDISASPTPQLDVRGLPGGVYFLRDAATGQRTRFVKYSGQ